MTQASSAPKIRSSTINLGLGRRQLLAGGTVLLTTALLPRQVQAARRADVADFPADVALDWYDLLLHLTKTTTGFSPPVASRAFAYIGIALYEALRPGMPGYRSLANVLPGLGRCGSAPSNLHFGLVANAVLAKMAKYLFPTTSEANKTEIATLQQSYESLYHPSGSCHRDRSTRYGKNVARYIFAWSTRDGGHQGYLNNFPSYTPPTGAGLWVPAPPAFQPALQPYWGENRAFALPKNDAFDPGPHDPAFSTAVGSPFYDLAVQVYDAVNNPVGDQPEIAAFWSDDPGETSTPPGHSISIASQVIAQEHVALDLAAEVYMKLGIGMADAFISCWATKYRHNLIRPVSYIQSHIDADWLPILDTPPFPEYTSGHSVQSGAMAEILADIFGDDISFVDHTHDDRGFAARSFDSFSAVANEAAISRLYGGIHYLPAINLGVTQGRQVGSQVNALPIR